MRHLHDLRIRLVECRATYRQTKDIYDLVKARATQQIQPAGKNAEERAVALTLAPSEHDAHKEAHKALRDAETAVERAEASLESARDERRASEWQIRAHLAHAIMGTGIPSDGDDPYGDDAFDNAIQASADQRAVAVFVSDPYDHAMHAA